MNSCIHGQPPAVVKHTSSIQVVPDVAVVIKNLAKYVPEVEENTVL